MAADVRLVRLTWENGSEFKIDTDLNGGGYITILEMQEDGDISSLWEHASKLCKKYFETQIEEIGGVMRG